MDERVCVRACLALTVVTDKRSVYLGTSSNWAFARQILTLAHDHLYQSPPTTGVLVFDGCIYNLGWDGCRTSGLRAPPLMPAMDYALHLVNIVQFHCGGLLHLLDQEIFMTNFHQFYANKSVLVHDQELWYTHFLLLLAFGKAFSSRKNVSNLPPGVEFFVTALQRLPDTVYLLRDPVSACEILCCIALYLQCIDYRLMAHVYVRSIVSHA